MDSERVKAIRAAVDAIPPMPADDADYTVWDGYTYAVEDFETQLRINGATWLRELLTDLDKAAAVVAAAHVLLTNDDRDGLQVTISYRALETFKAALAALDSEGGGV